MTMQRKQQIHELIEQLTKEPDGVLAELVQQMTMQQQNSTNALLAMAGEHARRMAEVVNQQHDMMREMLHRQLLMTDKNAAFQSAQFSATLKRAGSRTPAAAPAPSHQTSSGPGPGAGHLDDEAEMQQVDRDEILGDLNPRGTGVAGFVG